VLRSACAEGWACTTAHAGNCCKGWAREDASPPLAASCCACAPPPPPTPFPSHQIPAGPVNTGGVSAKGLRPTCTRTLWLAPSPAAAVACSCCCARGDAPLLHPPSADAAPCFPSICPGSV